jgi:PAS domain S-box-containing protein
VSPPLESAGEDERELGRLRMLVEASGRLLATLDIDELLPQVLDLARSALEADAYALWRRDPSTGTWTPDAASGLSDEYAAQASAAITENTAVISLDQPIIASDIETTEWLTPDHRAAHAREGNRALLAMPLAHGGEVIGTLVFYYRSPRAFGESELRSATSVATIAAAAIGTVSLYRAQAELATNLRFLAEAGTALSSSLDYDTTLATVARLAVGQFADWCIIDVVEGLDIRRVVVAAEDPVQQAALDELKERYPPTWDSPQPAAQALREAKPIVIEPFDEQRLEETTYDEGHLELLRVLAPRSAVATPLVARGEMLGAITFAWSQSARRYTPSELALIDAISSRAALAVDNARLYLRERTSGERLSFLAEASSKLAGSLDYETTLENVANLVVPRFADWCAIDMLEEDGELRRLAVVHKDPALHEWTVRSRDEHAPTMEELEGTARVARSGTPALYRRISDDLLVRTARTPEQLEVLRHLGMASAAVVPLTARGRVLGALMLVSSDPERLYDDDDLAFAEHIGRRAAAAVDNARLYRHSRSLLALLDTLFATAPVGLAFWDTKLCFQRINETLAEMNGLTIADHIGRAVDDVLPELGGQMSQDLRKVLATGEPVFAEAVGATPAQPNVASVWSAAYYPVRAADGEILGVGGVLQDVTERRRGENALRFLAEAGRVLGSSLDHAEMLQSVADLVVQGLGDWCTVHLLDEDGALVPVAAASSDPGKAHTIKAFEQRWLMTADGRGPAAVARTGVSELTPVITDEALISAAHDEDHLAALRELGIRSYMSVPLHARERLLGALSVASADERQRYDEQDVRLLGGLAGRAALAVENALLFRELEQRAQAALALTFVGDGVFLVDDRGVVRLWNTAASVITGLAAAQIVGLPAARGVPGWSAISERVIPSEAPGLPRTETIPVEIYGGERWFSVSAVAFSGGTVYAFRDLTEERRVERLKSEFVSTISHELRTPLAAIYGAALTLKRDEPALEAQREALLDVIASESERLAGIVNDILWASKLESGTLHVAVEHCDPGVLVGSVVEAARVHLNPRIDLRLTVEAGVPPVAADPDKVRQVLTNLIDNAIKYSPDGGHVAVTVEAGGRGVRFRVTDEGLGIPPAEHERIFDKFYRLDPELIRGIGGTGLGLYISRELVRRMEGHIEVESQDGVGSIFTVELPRA